MTGTELNYHHRLLLEFGIFGASFQVPRQIIAKLELMLTKTHDKQKHERLKNCRWWFMRWVFLLIINHDYFAQ